MPDSADLVDGEENQDDYKDRHGNVSSIHWRIARDGCGTIDHRFQQKIQYTLFVEGTLSN